MKIYYLVSCFFAGIIVCLLVLAIRGSIEEMKSIREARMKCMVQNVCREEMKAIRWWHIHGLEDKINEIIDERLAEKEGENEGD